VTLLVCLLLLLSLLPQLVHPMLWMVLQLRLVTLATLFLQHQRQHRQGHPLVSGVSCGALRMLQAGFAWGSIPLEVDPIVQSEEPWGPPGAGAMKIAAPP